MTTHPYKEKFERGTAVRIAPLDALEHFRRTWKYHHPLFERQLMFFSMTTVVEDVSYYHGGDVLYDLRGVPGIWHEELLEPASDTNNERNT